MRATNRFPHLATALLCSWTLLVSASLAPAQSPSHEDPRGHGVTPDDDLTLVVGTRFVTPAPNGASPKNEFTDARIPLSAFNDTDHCVDQHALELAMEYFNSLGRVLGKAGHYYVIPDTDVERSASVCEKIHGRPPKAWIDKKTKVIAFGRVVPTTDAPALERSVR